MNTARTTPGFVPPAPQRWWILLSRYAVAYRSELSSIIALTLINVGLNILKPWPLKLIVDYVVVDEPLPLRLRWLTGLPQGSASAGQLGWLVAGTILIFVAAELVKLQQTYWQAGIGQRMRYDLGADLFEHLQRLSLCFHSQQHAGDLVRRVLTDSDCVSRLVMGVYLPVLTALFSLTGMFVVMWQLSARLSLVALIALPAFFILIRLYSKPMTERNYRHQQLEGEMMTLAEQTYAALPVIQAFNRQGIEDRRFRRLTRQTLRAFRQATLAQLQFKVSIGTITGVSTALLMGLGGLQVLAGRLSVGSLLVFISYISMLYSPMETLAYSSSGYASAAAGAMRVLTMLGEKARVKESLRADAFGKEKVRGAVAFDNVSFGYDVRSPILKNISIQVQPGETIAIVGPTGAGKSTLVSLIPRFFDPEQGRVLIDGMNVKEMTLGSVRSQVGLVLQDPFLLPVSIAENIAYGCPEAPFEKIVQAARTAKAHHFIKQLPQGYDTVIGEQGATLSGGEKQRISIARALLKNAPILILDEPTSALDAQTEMLLMSALKQLMAGRTTFIIAHRLSTIQKANRIVVLEAGGVVETGTHQDLLAADGLYARLHKLSEFDETLIEKEATREDNL